MYNNINENLIELAQQFLIRRGIKSDEHIQMLHQIENFPQKDALQIFNFLLMQETDPQILLYIIKIIDKYRDKSSVSTLIELLLWKESCQERLKEPDDYLKVRCLIAKVLGNLKDYSAVVPLLYLLNNRDENYKLRLSAAEALGSIGDKYAVISLIDIVSDEGEKSVYLRESAAKALGMLGDIRAIDPFIKILESKKGIIDKFTFLKEKIIESLRKIASNDEKTIKALSSALMDESSCVRLGAIEALSEMNDDRIINLIEPMINDKEEDVARNAIDALYNIAGREYIIDLLNRKNMADWCRDEIGMILEQEDETEEDDESEE